VPRIVPRKVCANSDEENSSSQSRTLKRVFMTAPCEERMFA
jgi:hypothetical protein